MADRINELHGSIEGMRRPPGPDPMAPIGGHRPPELGEPQHCLVTTDAGAVPGLLIEWRHHGGPVWEGRVTYLQHLGGRQVRVEAWVSESRVRPVESTSTTTPI